VDQRTGQIVEEILVKETGNWRGHFARKPWVVVALAVGGGFLLSTLFTPKSQ
jgi:hypothetical protein